MRFDHLDLDVWRPGKPITSSKVVEIVLTMQKMIESNNINNPVIRTESLELAIKVLKKCIATGFSGEIKLNFHKGDMSKKIKKTETLRIE